MCLAKALKRATTSLVSFIISYLGIFHILLIHQFLTVDIARTPYPIRETREFGAIELSSTDGPKNKLLLREST
jgi:hypothetical protein